MSLLIVAGVVYRRQQTSCTIKLSQTGCVALETAVTREQQAKGLGGREAIAADQGMLFIYKQPQKTCFWMKDTKFNLDIVWLNDKKEITKIEPNLTPETYPQSFCSANSTKYVIELRAGIAHDNNLMVGQTLNF